MNQVEGSACFLIRVDTYRLSTFSGKKEKDLCGGEAGFRFFFSSQCVYAVGMIFANIVCFWKNSDTVENLIEQ